MTVDKQKLRELASKATPGPWAAVAVSDRAPELPGCRAHYAAAREHALYDQGAARALAADDAAFIAAASPSTVLALLDEIEAVRGDIDDERLYRIGLTRRIADAMSCEPSDDDDLVEAVRLLARERDEARAERDRLHATLKAVADVCIDKGKLRVSECVAEDAPSQAVAKLVEQRDAAIARAETILADRDLAIRRIAELTARAEQAERELDALVRSTHAALDAAGVTEEPRVETRIALLHGEVKSIEPRVVEAIAAWLEREVLRLDGFTEEDATTADIAVRIRAGAWRKS